MKNIQEIRETINNHLTKNPINAFIEGEVGEKLLAASC